MEAVEELETKLKKLSNTSYDSIDNLMRGIMKKYDVTAKDLHNAFVKKHHKTPDSWINEMKDPKGPTKPYNSPSEISKKSHVPLNKILQQVKIGTKVEGEHTTSKNAARITALQHVDELPDYYTKLKKIEKMKESLETAKMGLGGQRYCKLCRKAETQDECRFGPEMWSKFSIATVHPANMPEHAILEKRGLWDNINARKKKGLPPKKPGEKGYPKTLNIGEDHKEIASGKMKDEEGYMANVEFDQIERAVSILKKKIKKDNQQIPAWVQSKITRAADFIDTAADYMQSEETVSEDLKQARKNVGASKCWPGKVAKGTKIKGGKEVPNCVPANEDTCMSFSQFMQIAEARKKVKIDTDKPIEFKIADIGPGKKEYNVQTSKGWKDIKEVAAWQRSEGKNKEGGLNERGRKSYENENPGSDLKPPSKKVGNPRRASFCARMTGMKNKLTSKKTANDPDSRINKSLRAWNC